MNQEIIGKTVKVLPILLEKCSIPFFLKDKVYADFTDADAKKFRLSFIKLLDAIGIKKSKKRKKFFLTSKAVITKPLGPAKRVLSELETFDNIRITGTDKDRLYRPDATKLLYNVYFSLSVNPPSEWVQIFEEERRFPRHSMWRRAWIDSKYIVIHCCLDEIKMHLNDLKADVTNSNNKYRIYLRRQTLEKEKKKQRENKEKTNIDSAFSELEFD